MSLNRGITMDLGVRKRNAEKDGDDSVPDSTITGIGVAGVKYAAANFGVTNN